MLRKRTWEGGFSPHGRSPGPALEGPDPQEPKVMKRRAPILCSAADTTVEDIFEEP
jgi:hypothetical protein